MERSGLGLFLQDAKVRYWNLFPKSQLRQRGLVLSFGLCRRPQHSPSACRSDRDAFSLKGHTAADERNGRNGLHTLAGKRLAHTCPDQVVNGLFIFRQSLRDILRDHESVMVCELGIVHRVRIQRAVFQGKGTGAQRGMRFEQGKQRGNLLEQVDTDITASGTGIRDQLFLIQTLS